jgi:hypothetical protein
MRVPQPFTEKNTSQRNNYNNSNVSGRIRIPQKETHRTEKYNLRHCNDREQLS